MFKKYAGFSLVELMIVIAIIGVVSAIAYPAFTDSAKKSRRADAITVLLDMQLQQEKWRSVNSEYTSTLSELGYDTSVSPDGYYDLTIDSADANTYQMTASTKAGTAQDGDTCASFILTQNGPDISTPDKKTCWNK